MLTWCVVGFLIPVVVLSTPVIIGTWRRTDWWILDFFAILLPGPVWVLLAEQGGVDKTLSNLVELPILAVLVSAASLARGLTGNRWPRLPASSTFLAFALLLTLALYSFLPPFTE